MDYSCLLLVVVFSLIGGVFSLIGGIILLSQKSLMKSFSAVATPFAAGALLAAVFLDLLVDGLEESSPRVVLGGTLVGMVAFFILERVTHWFHHHHDGDSDDKHKNVLLIIIGDTLHNALDGVAIAVSFLVSVPTGIVTTMAVAAHEIPQEIGDFGLLLARGMSRKNVLLVNLGSALATLLLAVVTFVVGSSNKLPIGFLLGLSAGFLLYIAASDIIPTIHQESPKHKLFDKNIVYLLLGIAFVAVSINLAHMVTG
jgi:zinc and cadmium transporter